MSELVPLYTWNKNKKAPEFHSYIANGLSCPHCVNELMDTDGIVRYRQNSASLWVQVSCSNKDCGFVSYRTINVNNGDQHV